MDPELAAAKLALTQAQERKATLANDQKAGTLMPADQVRATWLAIAADLRIRLIAVPGRVAARLSLDRPTAAALDREIRAAMAELAASRTSLLDGLRAEFFAALRPPPALDLPDWIERTFRVLGDVSAQTGPMQLIPVQRGIAEAMGSPEIERATVVKPVRLAYSTLLAAFIAYHVENDPAPILAVQPIEADCRDWMVGDLEPIFGASPRLRNLLGVEHDPTGRSKSRPIGGSRAAAQTGGRGTFQLGRHCSARRLVSVLGRP